MRRWIPSAPLLAAVIGAIPTAVALSAGLPATVDGPLHLDRTASVAYLLAAAPLPHGWPLPPWPRWAPHLLQGWGYPIHHFYPPGVPLVAGAAVALGARAEWAHVALIAGAWIAAAVGTFRLARRALPPLPALLAAGVAAFSPVRLHEVQVLGNLPQLVAVALVPWTLAAAVDLGRRPSAACAAHLGGWLASIALCHHVTLALAAPLAAATALVAAGAQPAPRRRLARTAAAIAVAGAAAAALAAVYLWPAAADAPRVQLDKASAGMFVAATALVPPSDLVAAPTRIDRRALGVPIRHGWGPAIAGLWAIGVVAVVRRRCWSDGGARRLAAGLTALGAAVVALALPAAAPLWGQGWAGLVQFPWRLLGVAEPLLAVGAGAGLLWLGPRGREAGFWLALASLAAVAGPWLPPLDTQPPAVDRSARAAVAAERRADAPPGTTSSMEYLPHGAQVDLAQPPSDAALAAYGDGRWWVDVDRDRLPPGTPVDVVAVGRRGSAIEVAAGPALDLPLRQIWFPGWTAEVDGRPAAVQNGDDGHIIVAVPASAALRRVRVRYAGTPLARWAAAVSAAAWLALGRAAVRRRRRPVADRAAEDAPLPARRLALLLAGAGAVAAIAVPRWSWLAPRSDGGPPLGMRHAVGAVLSDATGPAVELLGFAAPAPMRAGQAASVRLYWRAVRPLDRRYRPFVQLQTLGRGDVVANSTATDPGGRPTRSWPLDRYVIDAHRLAPDAAAPARTVRLVAGLFADDGGARLLDAAGRDHVVLTEVRLTPRWGDAAGRRARADIERRAVAAMDAAGAAGRAALPVRIGDALALEAAAADWALGPDGAPGVRVTLAWRAAGAVDRPLTVFRHAVAADGAVWAQADGPPDGGDAPTDRWRPGDRVVDDAFIAAPPGAPVPIGPLRVRVGLYDPADGGRWAAVGPDGRLPDDAVVVPVAGRPDAPAPDAEDPRDAR